MCSCTHVYTYEPKWNQVCGYQLQHHQLGQHHHRNQTRLSSFHPKGSPRRPRVRIHFTEALTAGIHTHKHLHTRAHSHAHAHAHAHTHIQSRRHFWVPCCIKNGSQKHEIVAFLIFIQKDYCFLSSTFTIHPQLSHLLRVYG